MPQWELRIGSANKNNGGRIIKVKKYLLHPKYDKRTYRDYDFCVLYFQERITFSTKVARIEIVKQDERQVQSQCVIAGFGMDWKKKNQDYLKAAVVETIGWERCKDAYPAVELTSAQICATSTNGTKGWVLFLLNTSLVFIFLGFCAGDAGGPMIDAESGKLVGIISHSKDPCTDSKTPGIFARIPEVSNWLQEIMKANS